MNYRGGHNKFLIAAFLLVYSYDLILQVRNNIIILMFDIENIVNSLLRVSACINNEPFIILEPIKPALQIRHAVS